MMRHGFYGTYHAPYVSVAYVAALAGGTLVFGLLLLWRHHKTLLEN
jgi:capsular polysaccharide transport system permease protein